LYDGVTAGMTSARRTVRSRSSACTSSMQRRA